MKNRSFEFKKHCQQQLYEGRKFKVRNLGIITLIFFIFFFSSISAQEAVNASGGDATDTGGSVSYSIGTAVFTTNVNSAGSVAQGVQNPYEIFVITGIGEEKGIELFISAYPNPVSDYLILKVESDKVKGSSYQLYNLEGKLLESKVLTNSETQIAMDALNPSTYLLKIMNNNKEIKTFKIIKN